MEEKDVFVTEWGVGGTNKVLTEATKVGKGEEEAKKIKDNIIDAIGDHGFVAEWTMIKKDEKEELNLKDEIARRNNELNNTFQYH